MDPSPGSDEVKVSRRRPLGARGLGVALIILGVIATHRRIESLASDGTIESPVFTGLILAGRLALVIMGAVLWSSWRPNWRATGGLRPWLLAALSLVASIVLAEGLIRIILGPIWKWAPPPFYVGEFENRESASFEVDSLVGWRMKPGREFRSAIDGHQSVYRANDQGFRSPYTHSSIQREEKLIVLVGDSFAWGTGVEYAQTFAAVLDDRLDDAVIYNQAQPGMGLDQMWMTMRRALDLAPDIVIAAFIDPDFDRSLTAFRSWERMNKPTFVLSSSGLVPQTARDRPNAIVRFAERNSGLLALTRAVGRGIGYTWSTGRWWSINAAILAAMAREAEERGARLVVVRLPYPGVRPAFPSLLRHLDTLSAVLVDLAPTAAPGIFFKTDDHINRAGHLLVADSLESVVRKMLN